MKIQCFKVFSLNHDIKVTVLFIALSKLCKLNIKQTEAACISETHGCFLCYVLDTETACPDKD